MAGYIERRQYIYDKNDKTDDGNYLIVSRVYWWWLIPYKIQFRKFNTDNAIWINNDIFGYGNQHNIDKAFES